MSDMTPNERFDKRLREVVRTTRSPAPERERLERLMRDFHALHDSVSWLQRLANWFATPHRLPAPAIAFAAVLILAQGIALVALMPSRQDDLYRGIAARCEEGPRIRVVFKPDAPQAETVILLRKVEATVTAGPSETGELWLSIPQGRSIAEALAQMRSSAIVDEAIIVPAGKRNCTP